MTRFDRYLFKNLLIACVFITVVLTSVVFLTQSLRLLELILDSGASSSLFWFLTFLALPRFFEIIVPLAMMASVVFIFNKMSLDSEMIAIRAGGVSPAQIVRAPLVLALSLSLFLYLMTMIIAPTALSSLKQTQQVLKAQFSTFLFREGVFNKAGKGLTVYIRNRTKDGELEGVLIHDSRAEVPNPSTIMAQRGVLVSNEESHQVVVFDGSRQEFDREKRILQRLNFDRYTIEIPSGDPVHMRWSEPNERTIFELFNPDPNNERDIKSARDFTVEIHKRFTAPLLTIAFTLISVCFLLLGPSDRKGQSLRITFCILSIVVLQGLYLVFTNIARNHDAGLVFMYLLILVPILFPAFLLSEYGEEFRRQWLYKKRTVQS